MFYNGTERISVSNHDDSLAVEDLGADLIVPVGENTVDGDFKRLSCWQHVKRETSIARVEFRMALIIKGKFRGRNIKAASPQFNLFLTMLSSSFGLIETLKSTIMTFIKSPMLLNWNVMAAELSCNCVISHDCAG